VTVRPSQQTAEGEYQGRRGYRSPSVGELPANALPEITQQ